jgi:arabinose-5-phosphate isomerase
LKTFDEIRTSAAKTLQIESDAVENLISLLTDDFPKAVELIYNSQGRVVFTGIGKSANIASKIVATFNSTGTPAIFMHAADAIHGDLGNIQQNDVIVCISKSGNTPEVKVLIPLINNLGNKIIGLVGNPDSFLATFSDLVLNTFVSKEACPNNLAPTASTTAQLAMGDALAIALMEYRGFSQKDFATYHPGGTLGKRLYLKMKDLLNPQNRPLVSPNSKLKEIIVEISAKRSGASAVIENNLLIGIITDGDVRRMLEKHEVLDNITALDIMNSNPKTISAEALATEGFNTMEKFNITQLLVVDGDEYLGIVHLHDILKEGIF